MSVNKTQLWITTQRETAPVIEAFYKDNFSEQAIMQFKLKYRQSCDRAFDVISLYNTWLRKIDEVFGSDWSENELYLKGNPSFIYSSYIHALQPIIEYFDFTQAPLSLEPRTFTKV